MGKEGKKTKQCIASFVLAALLLAGCSSVENKAPTVTSSSGMVQTTPKPAAPKATATPKAAATPKVTAAPKVFDPGDIPLRSVDSSAISEAGYDKAERVLVVRFKESGIRYCYYDVPPSVWDGLLGADSIGRYFNQNSKNQYEYKRLD